MFCAVLLRPPLPRPPSANARHHLVQEALFERYDCSSAHRNQIGIDIDIRQLLRVLRSALTAAELVELRLRLIADRASGGVSAAEVAPKPYLCLTCPGDALNVQQDIPVNTPLRPSGTPSKLAQL